MQINVTSCPIVICGQQRSGTTAFARALKSRNDIEVFGEVFQTDDKNLERQSNYYCFRKNASKLDRPLIKTEKFQKSAFIEYIEFLSSLTDKTYFVVDVKYNSWHHFNTAWHDNCAMPTMLHFFTLLNAPVFHLTRENLFEQYVSFAYARKTGKWHYQKKDQTSGNAVKIKIEPARCLHHMELSQANKLNFCKWLKGYGSLVELSYESMFCEDRLSDIVVNSVKDALRERYKKHMWVPFKKTPYATIDVVENRDELLVYFESTEFQWMVESSLRIDSTPT